MSNTEDRIRGRVSSAILDKVNRLFRNDDAGVWVELLQNARRRSQYPSGRDRGSGPSVPNHRGRQRLRNPEFPELADLWVSLSGVPACVRLRIPLEWASLRCAIPRWRSTVGGSGLL